MKGTHSIVPYYVNYCETTQSVASIRNNSIRLLFGGIQTLQMIRVHYRVYVCICLCVRIKVFISFFLLLYKLRCTIIVPLSSTGTICKPQNARGISRRCKGDRKDFGDSLFKFYVYEPVGAQATKQQHILFPTFPFSYLLYFQDTINFLLQSPRLIPHSRFHNVP